MHADASPGLHTQIQGCNEWTANLPVTREIPVSLLLEKIIMWVVSNGFHYMPSSILMKLDSVKQPMTSFLITLFSANTTNVLSLDVIRGIGHQIRTSASAYSEFHNGA